MERLIRFFIRNRILSNMILLFLFAGGFYSLMTIQREGLPSIDLNTISITTIFPGAAPEDVELNVTVPIERELEAVSGIDKLLSTSSENLSVITIEADPDFEAPEMSRLLDEVRSAVAQVQDLPAEIDGRPVIKELRLTDLPILEVALTGPKDTLRKLGCQYERELRQIPGVGLVKKVGCFDREVHIELDPVKMEEKYISFREVINSILTRNIRASGGTLSSYLGRKNIVTLSKFQDPLDVRKVILRSNFEERRILLSEVATVSMTNKDERLRVRSNGRQGISLVINKKPGADVIEVVDAVKAYIEKQTMPESVKYDFINDLSRRTRIRIDILKDNGLMGFALVIIVLFLFLNLRSAVWTAFGIPFSILGAFVFMPLAGEIINIMTLAGFLIVIGLLVDDAIVVAEHVESYKESGMPGEDAAVRGASEMVKPVTAAALTTMAAYIPMYFLGGASGKFIWGLPTIVVITLFVSLFESFFILPGHLAHSKKSSKAKAAWIVNLENRYQTFLEKVLHKKYYLIGALVLLLILSFGLVMSQLRVNMFPSRGTERFYVKITAPTGASMKRTGKDVRRMEKLLLDIKQREGEIISFSTRIGHKDTGGAARTSGDHENWAIITVYLNSISERERSAKEIIGELRKRAELGRGTSLLFEEMRIGPPLGRPAEIVVTGNDPQKREIAITNIIKTMEAIEGVTDIARDDDDKQAQVVIVPDYKKLAAYGLTTKDVADVIRIAFDGRKVTSIQTLNEEIFYRVILAEEYRQNVAAFSRLKVRNKIGKLIPLDKLVSIRNTTSPQFLRHFDGVQAVTITAELDTEKTSALAVERSIRQNLLSQWEAPQGVRVLIRGEAQATRQIFGGVMFAFGLAFVGIFFLIALVVKNSLQSLFVLIVVPFTLIGVIWTWFIHGLDISFFTILGFLGLAGIVVNDSIVMVDRLNKAVAENELSIHTIAERAKSRLRPVLLTTITTIAGLLPTAYGVGGDDPLVNPLALTLAFGLLFATVITLFLVPGLYLVQADIRHFLARVLRKLAGNKA